MWILLVLVSIWPWSGAAGGEVLQTPPPEAGLTEQDLPADIAPLMDQLASQDPAARLAAITALGERGDPKLLALFEALREGSLYVWTDPQGRHVTVIAGEPVMRDDKAVVPLYTAYEHEPMQTTETLPLLVAPEDLQAIEVDRRLRQVMKPLIDGLKNRLNLASPDATMRRWAASELGNLGKPSVIPWLEGALAIEGDRWVRYALEEAIQLLRLSQQDSSVRITAATKLGELRSARALPVLKGLLQAGTGTSDADRAWRQALTAAIARIETWGTVMEGVETLFRGLSLSSILLLMALGLGVIFGLMGVINMAHGELMMLGAYTTFVVQEGFRSYLPAPLFDYYFVLAIPASCIVAAMVGLILESCLIRFLYGRPLETLLATWGVSLVLVQAARKTFGDLTAVTSPHWLSGGIQVMVGVQLPYNRLFIIGLTAACVLGMYLLLFRTALGLKVRAVTQNRAMSACLGISTRRVDGGAFALGSALAGLAGCALTQVGNVDPGLGQNYIVDSFLVVVTGGVGKLVGTVAAALGIGGLNKLLEPGFGAIYAKILVLLLVIVFLQRRPSGLFMTRGRHAES
jgi:urea transport system permease protein